MALHLSRKGNRAVEAALLCGSFAAAASGCGGNGQTSSGSTSGSGGTGAASTTSGTGGSTTSGTGGDMTTSSGTGGETMHLAEWGKKFLGSEQTASSVAVDAQGNIYVGGQFYGGLVDFGAGQHDCPLNPMITPRCGFLVKLDPTGKTIWSVSFSAERTRAIDVTALAVTSSGVFLAATWNRAEIMHAPLELGAGPMDPPGDNPMVLAKFDLDGKALWSAAFGDDMGDVVPSSLIANGADSFTVGGGFTTGALDLGGGSMPFQSASTLFLARFDAGKVAWQKSFGGATAQDLAGVGAGPSGKLLLAGTFEKSIDLGGPPLTTMEAWSIFQATLDDKGAFVSDVGFGGTGMLRSMTGAAVDPSGSTLATGFFDGTLKTEGAPLTAAGDKNGYLVKIDGQGKVAFAKASAAAATSTEGSYCVGADGSANVLWGERLFFVEGGEDVRKGAITKLDGKGAELWKVDGKSFGPRAFAFDAMGNVIVVGEFFGELDIVQGGPIKAPMGTSAFVAKLPP